MFFCRCFINNIFNILPLNCNYISVSFDFWICLCDISSVRVKGDGN
jgi:hypothetical protein